MLKLLLFVVVLFLVVNADNHAYTNDLVHYQLNDYTDAYLTLKTNSISDLLIKMQNVECVRCLFNQIATINYINSAKIRLDTSYSQYRISVSNSKVDSICFIDDQDYYSFGENGTYELFIDINNIHFNSTNCQMKILTEPNFGYFSLMIASVIIISIALIYILARHIYLNHWSSICEQVRSLNRRPSSIVDEEENPQERLNFLPLNETVNEAQKSSRLKCIDTLRGISLALMILINYGSGGYSMLDHAVWNGLHLADTVFPCFIFLMGVSIPLSFNAYFKKNQMTLKKKDIFIKIIKRSFLLFLFGLLTSNSSKVTLRELRIFGVLQRFSVSYFICASMEVISLYFHNFNYDNVLIAENTWKHKIIEIYLYPVQWILMIVFAAIWVLITLLLPVHGCPTGYLGPGGLHENGKHFNCTGGAAGYVDRLLLGESHVYQYPTFKDIYQTRQPFDPEGLLGFLTSCVLVYLGVSAGHIFVHYRKTGTRVFHFFIHIIIFGSCALLLCKSSRDDGNFNFNLKDSYLHALTKSKGWIPINKNLWSISFVLALASLSLFCVTLLYLLIDEWLIFSGKPFNFLGKNSIFIYIAHIVFGNFFPVQFYISNSHGYLLAMNLYGIILWCLIAYYLDYKKIYINL